MSAAKSYARHIFITPLPTDWEARFKLAEGDDMQLFTVDEARALNMGTTIILNGMQRNTPSRRRGGTSRNGSSRASALIVSRSAARATPPHDCR